MKENEEGIRVYSAPNSATAICDSAIDFAEAAEAEGGVGGVAGFAPKPPPNF